MQPKLGGNLDDAIAAAKSKSLVDLVSRNVNKLERHGREHVGLCPFHEEKTPSFFVNEKKGLYQCFGCGACGDIIDFAQNAYRLTFSQAVKMLAGDDVLPQITASSASTKEDPDQGNRNSRYAIDIWRNSQPISGTIAETYLRNRAITVQLPDTLRFHPFTKHTPSSLYLPAMVAAVVVSPSRQIIAVHRTFLKPDGSGKIPHSRDKTMLGPCKGGAARLMAWSGGPLIVSSGIETSLSVLQMTGIATWAALSDSGIENLVLPDNAKDLTICADHDVNGSGQASARRAAAKWEAEGRTVKLALPITRGTDFNDMLKAGKTFSL